jgi:hypothetical protein
MRKRATPPKELRPALEAVMVQPDADVNEESASKFLDALGKFDADGTARARRRGIPTRDPKTEAIVAEMKGLGIGTSDFPIVLSPIGSDIIAAVENIKPQRVPKELEWTIGLERYEQAYRSAVDALVRLAAETQALRCSFNAESPRIEQALFSIKAGLINEKHPYIPQLVAYAQSIGEGRTIHPRIAGAFHAADRNSDNDGTMFPDLNKFRVTLSLFWTGFVFWQMSDRNITKFMLEHNLFPAGFKANRSTITEARKQLGLRKGPQQVVKSVGPNFQWFFKDGYPTQQEQVP